MLPETAFHEGENTVEVFKIEDQGAGVSLARIAALGQDSYELSNAGSAEQLVAGTKGPIPIRPGALEGAVDLVRDYSSWLTVVGWSVDKEKLVPASRIVVFVDGVQVSSGRPSVSRDDLVPHFKAAAVAGAGFQLNLPKLSLQKDEADIRIFALSADSRVASEVPLSRALDATLRRLSQ
jgi:hypothetical protein